MECQKITNLLGNTSAKAPRFIIKKWIEIYDQFRETCNTNKQIRFKTSMLSSDLCDCSDAYIVVKGTITVSATDVDNYIKEKKNRPLAFKNNAPFICYI